MADQDLLPVAITKRHAGHHDQRDERRHQPAFAFESAGPLFIFISFQNSLPSFLLELFLSGRLVAEILRCPGRSAKLLRLGIRPLMPQSI